MEPDFSSENNSFLEDEDFEIKKKYTFIENPIIKTEAYKEYALRQNIIRTKFISVAILVLTSVVFYNHITGRIIYDYYRIVNMYAIAIVAIFNFLFSFYLKKCNYKKCTFAELVLVLFWVTAIVIDTPTFLQDAGVTFQPVNITTWLAGLGILLVITRVQILIIFPVFLLFNLAIAFTENAPSFYILDIVVRTLLAGGIAYFVQYPYNIAAVKNLMNSTLDPLTKLMNRRAGLKRIKLILQTNKRVKRYTALYMLDIDNFKLYNDTFGHQIGDKALSLVAHHIDKTFTRSEDTKVRYGGEEFLICASVNSKENAKMLQERLHKAISKAKMPMLNGEPCGAITVSIGYIIIEHNKSESLEYLIRCADLALYEAKRRGKNCTVEFSDDMNL